MGGGGLDGRERRLTSAVRASMKPSSAPSCARDAGTSSGRAASALARWPGMAHGSVPVKLNSEAGDVMVYLKLEIGAGGGGGGNPRADFDLKGFLHTTQNVHFFLDFHFGSCAYVRARAHCAQPPFFSFLKMKSGAQEFPTFDTLRYLSFKR